MPECFSAFEQRLHALQKGEGGLCHLREICSVWPSCNFEEPQVARAQKTLLWFLTAKISEDLVVTEHAPASLSSQCCPDCLCLVPPEWWSMPQPLSSDVWQDCSQATPRSGWACFSPWLWVLRRTFPFIAVRGCSWSQHWEQGVFFLWSQRYQAAQGRKLPVVKAKVALRWMARGLGLRAGSTWTGVEGEANPTYCLWGGKGRLELTG